MCQRGKMMPSLNCAWVSCTKMQSSAQLWKGVPSTAWLQGYFDCPQSAPPPQACAAGAVGGAGGAAGGPAAVLRVHPGLRSRVQPAPVARRARRLHTVCAAIRLIMAQDVWVRTMSSIVDRMPWPGRRMLASGWRKKSQTGCLRLAHELVHRVLATIGDVPESQADNPCRSCVARDAKGIRAGGTDAAHLRSQASRVWTQAVRPPQPSTPVGR